MNNSTILQKFQSLPTPFYYYDMELLENTIDTAKSEADKYGFHLHYAVKANFNEPVLKMLAQKGFGADCVSGREVQTSVKAGFDANAVVFAGVGKSDVEIDAALDLDIFCFNCESLMEIEVINELAAAKGKTAQIALRINPNVNANTHKYITTGLAENKFGINMWELDSVLETLNKCPNIELIGLHFHIGSQITDLSSFKNLATKINTIQEWFFSRQIMVKVINAGGGLGIDYHNPDGQIPDFAEYFKIFNDFLELRPGQEVHFELGRSLVTQCGSLISRALYIKNGIKKNFAILDAGMTELIRPALYSAHHEIANLTSTSQTIIKYDVVGPICESTDCFAKDLELSETSRGDIFQIKSAGGYGEVMASDYNLKTLYPALYSTEIV
ncbi:MAG: diaminopimelate decarboxylase [Flavobacteriales bacterium]|jgi:diaminopimelate decarboxylase|tara:strand:- start:18498 stop:19655 length:1158 start_codon:yes stop_codon:yes gene_type:complete